MRGVLLNVLIFAIIACGYVALMEQTMAGTMVLPNQSTSVASGPKVLRIETEPQRAEVLGIPPLMPPNREVESAAQEEPITNPFDERDTGSAN